MQALRRRDDVYVRPVDISTPSEVLARELADCDFIYHLAGANRPTDENDFEKSNVDLTTEIVEILERSTRLPTIVFSSSIQASQDNPYGRSKKKAETVLRNYSVRSGAKVHIFRLPNVFGKWSKPFYNSAIATFCHQAANKLPLTIHDPSAPLSLVYIDDVVSAFIAVIGYKPTTDADGFCTVHPTHSTTVGEVSELIGQCAQLHNGGEMPDLGNYLNRCLHATYLSFLPPEDLAYHADKKQDSRGVLFELLRSSHGGQIFVSRTAVGVTRGNHYHDSKAEKFCVVAGSASITLRHLSSNKVIRFDVKGEECRIVDVPPGYAHAISNIAQNELVTVFWSTEVFDALRPDTFREEV
jgi:UDP-2-acetamido-2,6-beta-L-arabino-hexul-4-ose reductase